MLIFYSSPFQSTTIINFKPQQLDKILSCNFNHCELFSCILGMEDETALSILDPVTINCELKTKISSSGELVKVLLVITVTSSFHVEYVPRCVWFYLFLLFRSVLISFAYDCLIAMYKCLCKFWNHCLNRQRGLEIWKCLMKILKCQLIQEV